MIKIKNYDKKNQKLVLNSDIHPSLANAIRRSVLEIPIIAIDEVSITKNDSALYDEILAHRLGLIPIKTEKGTKEIKFRLKETGPKAVYSTDIKPSAGTEIKIPIVILDKDQEIEVVCEARLGNGNEHIKYSPGLVYYTHNIENRFMDFVHVNENGEISFNVEEVKEKLGEESFNQIKKLKENNELIFNLESWGQLEVMDIFPKAIAVLSDNLEELNKAVK